MNQYQEAEVIANWLKPFSRGSFAVGGVAYNPNAVRDNEELEVIAVVPDFRRVNFAAIENALVRKLNLDAVKLASQGWIDVFDTHYKSDGGFDVGVYLRSEEAHKRVCGLRGYTRFTDKPGIPRSCSVRSLEGDEMVLGDSASVDGGRIFTHYPVVEKDDKVWVGFPGLNILMTPRILTGGDFLRGSFDTFNANLRQELSERYGSTRAVSLVNCIPPRFVDKVPPELKDRLEHFMD